MHAQEKILVATCCRKFSHEDRNFSHEERTRKVHKLERVKKSMLKKENENAYAHEKSIKNICTWGERLMGSTL